MTLSSSADANLECVFVINTHLFSWVENFEGGGLRPLECAPHPEIMVNYGLYRFPHALLLCYAFPSHAHELRGKNPRTLDGCSL